MKKISLFLVALLCINSVHAGKYQKKVEKKDTKISLTTPTPIKKKTTPTAIHSKSSPVKSITFTNLIDKEAVTYQKHWYKPVPTKCSVTINNQPLLTTQDGKKFTVAPSIEIPADTKKIVAQFEWEIEKFGKKWHHEKKEIVFEVAKNAQNLTLDFDWELKERFKLADAKLISCRELAG